MSFENNKKYLKDLFGKLDYGIINKDKDDRLSIQDNGKDIMCLLKRMREGDILVLHKVPLCTPGTGIREIKKKMRGKEYVWKYAKIHPFDANNKDNVKLLEDLFEKHYINKR
jgi:predicted GTPase